jgi:hypothetical protein
VPLGFLAPSATLVWAKIARVLTSALGLSAAAHNGPLVRHQPQMSYRIPGAFVWPMAFFLAGFAVVAVIANASAARRQD